MFKRLCAAAAIAVAASAAHAQSQLKARGSAARRAAARPRLGFRGLPALSRRGARTVARSERRGRPRRRPLGRGPRRPEDGAAVTAASAHRACAGATPERRATDQERRMLWAHTRTARALCLARSSSRSLGGCATFSEDGGFGDVQQACRGAARHEGPVAAHGQGRRRDRRAGARRCSRSRSASTTRCRSRCSTTPACRRPMRRSASRRRISSRRAASATRASSI